MKPCPFCGTEDARVRSCNREEPGRNYSVSWLYVECRECWATGPYVYADLGEEEAVELWNNRELDVTKESMP